METFGAMNAPVTDYTGARASHWRLMNRFISVRAVGSLKINHLFSHAERETSILRFLQDFK